MGATDKLVVVLLSLQQWQSQLLLGPDQHNEEEAMSNQALKNTFVLSFYLHS